MRRRATPRVAAHARATAHRAMADIRDAFARARRASAASTGRDARATRDDDGRSARGEDASNDGDATRDARRARATPNDDDDDDDDARGRTPTMTYARRRKRGRAETATETRRATASATKSRAATIARSTTRAGEGGEGKARADARAIGDAEKRRTQMCLDLGQSSMRHATCARCGLVYAKGDPSDEKTHAQYHAKFLANANGGGAGAMTLKPGEGQSAVWESEDGEARCVALDGGKATKSAIERVARGIERELNMPEDWILQQAKGAVKAYVCVSKKGHRVVGALFAEKIARAYRTLPDVKNATDATEGTIVSHGGVAENAVCGIRAVWVHSSARRAGLARAMLNAARARAVPGYVVAAAECAFTQPTESGTALALAYCESDTFLVY